ncbi:hypothetical protein PMAYCL1PPCAC_26976, partial [Pristionchus mayeri]
IRQEELVLFENETPIKEEPMDVKEEPFDEETPKFGNFTKDLRGIAEDSRIAAPLFDHDYFIMEGPKEFREEPMEEPIADLFCPSTGEFRTIDGAERTDKNELECPACECNIDRDQMWHGSCISDACTVLLPHC